MSDDTLDRLAPVTLEPAPGNPDLLVPNTNGATPWIKLDSMPNRPDEFTFVVLSDRTGAARPGVFEHGVAVTNLLRPDFAIQVGDEIEGYTTDPDVLAEMWAEFDSITDAFEVPLFRVTGNHDVSNDVMRDEWLRRFGVLHYHFVYRDVLFLMLDSQDPPQTMADFADKAGANGLPMDASFEFDADEMRKRIAEDPTAVQKMVEQMTDWDGRMPGNFSDEQFAWIEHVLAQHADVRWTIVCMHMPIWQDETHEGYVRLQSLLGDRDFTMFAGHVHNYRRQVIDGREHIRLGPTGGLWVKSGDDGNFDHVMHVTMTPAGPHIANIVLEGVLPAEGGEFKVAPRFPTVPAVPSA